MQRPPVRSKRLEPTAVPRPGSKLKGGPKEDEQVRVSKTLSWVLRHGAKTEGLFMRPDGYARVRDLLKLPRFQSVKFQDLERIVQSDAKQRYQLRKEVDDKATVSASSEGVWWIRANQGHSLKNLDLQHDRLTDASQVPMAVHGTSLKAWDSIAKQGLSRMTRQHIHLAQGVPGDGVLSGMRNSSQVLIYIDLHKAIKDGVEFHLSDNGVILTSGDKKGFLSPIYFKRVVNAKGVPFSGWEGEKPSHTSVEEPEEKEEESAINDKGTMSNATEGLVQGIVDGISKQTL